MTVVQPSIRLAFQAGKPVPIAARRLDSAGGLDYHGPVQLPTLAAKLRIPEPTAGLVLRPRLLERLGDGLLRDGAFTRRLTLLSAPAGFGKTTTACLWVRQCRAIEPRPDVAWLSLDESDREPAVFISRLRAALRVECPDLPSTPDASGPDQAAHPEALMTALLNELADMERNTLVVLDDYHRAACGEVDRALALLVEYLPPRLHVAVATRTEPDLPLPRCRARGQVAEFRSEDLRFDAAEAADFLRRSMKLEISEDDAAALERRTEGWAAGLQLAALSLRGRSDAAAFIASFSGSHRFVLDYLLEEVLQREPEELRTFLLRTSILDQCCASLCAAVAALDGRALLDAVERANLFLLPLDDRREWYRYHQLFAEVLRARLAQERPSELAGLHSRASAWYADEGCPEEAIRHALLGRDYESAAELIELRWPAMDGEYRSALWLGWARQLPEEAIRARPVLSAACGWALLDTGELEKSEGRFLDAENPPPQFLVADEAQYRSMPAFIAVARAYRALALGDVPGAFGQANRALALVPDQDLKWRTAAGALVGITRYMEGRLPEAEAALLAAMSTARASGRLSESESMAFLLADLRVALGRLREAEQIFEDSSRALARAERRLPLIAAELHRGRGELCLERGDLEAAEEEFRTGRALGEEAALTDWRYRVSLAEARLAEIRGELDDALELLEEAERFHVRTPLPDLRPAGAMRCRIWIRLGRHEQALAWARGQGLSVDRDIGFMEEYGYLTLARALLARFGADGDRDSLEAASRLLGRLLEAAEAGGRRGVAVEILALLALARAAGGDLASALPLLGRAVGLAAGEGYALAFMSEGPAMAGLLRRLQSATAEPAIKAYAGRLLSIGTGGPGRATSPSSRGAGVPALPEQLSGRELEVLRLLRSDLSGPELARELYISLNTLRTHTKNIFDKLAVNSRRAAVRRAEVLGLV